MSCATKNNNNKPVSGEVGNDCSFPRCRSSKKRKRKCEKSTRTSLSNSFDFFFISLLISQGGERLGAFNQIVLRLAKKTGGNNRMHKTAAGGGGKQTPTKKPDDALARLQVWTLLPGEYFLLNVGAGRRPFEIYIFFLPELSCHSWILPAPHGTGLSNNKRKNSKKKKKNWKRTL